MSAPRDVSDPITHETITVHDSSSQELEQIPPPSPTPPLADENERERVSKQQHDEMQGVVDEETHGRRWDDPAAAESKRNVQTTMIGALTGGVGAFLGVLLSMGSGRLLNGSLFSGIVLGSFTCFLVAVGSGFFAAYRPGFPAMPQYSTQSSESPEKKPRKDEAPETATWLNDLLRSMWPLVDPDLFTSVADMLEDTMQASLPKMVHGVRVADLGQGVEPLRVLGIRYLEPGDAARTKHGMAAEKGDFVNMEVAVAYRARQNRKGLKGRSQNMHLLIEFWTVADLKLPVWVEVTGILATARVRLQLTPNPPFFSLLTLTLLGQPKVTLSATPLTKGFVNVMDIPGLSKWLQSNINAAISEYVAPRSMTLDLKTMLMGQEKLDTDAIGMIYILVRSAISLKDGDGGKVWASRDKKRGDVYVTVSWAQWGKPLWATRIIQSEPEPIWMESTAVLVRLADVNAQERLRVQVWDSDRYTADDVLGTAEVSLKELMSESKTQNQLSQREDGLADVDGTPWPGTLKWDVGFYSKIGLDELLQNRPEAGDVSQLKQSIQEKAEQKLREAKDDERDESNEVAQQKAEDLREATDEIIAAARPSEEWPSGIVRVWIQMINGLECEKVRESGVREDEDEGGDDLPSAYCEIMINQQKMYKTRTKIKSNKPYYNTGTEKFVRDWQTSTVFIAVRDARPHENDPLLGIIVLPLRETLKEHSQINDSFPLVGGIGFGRVQLSVVFRSVKIKLPRELRGWDVGTLEILPEVKASEHFPPDLTTAKLVLRTLYGKGKMRAQHTGGWKEKRGAPLHLAVMKRYASCLVVFFKKDARLGSDRTQAFCCLWFKDIPDDEEKKITLPVRMNEDGALRRARANASGDIGRVVGTVDLTLRFYPGMSGYHHSAASHDPNQRDVMDVLDCAEESREIKRDQVDPAHTSDAGSDGGSSSSSSDSDDEPESDQDPKDPQHMQDDGSRNVLDEVKEYKNRHGALHRRHRGMMQWRGVRELAWAKDEVKEKAGEVKDKMKLRQRDGGVDTEV